MDGLPHIKVIFKVILCLIFRYSHLRQGIFGSKAVHVTHCAGIEHNLATLFLCYGRHSSLSANGTTWNVTVVSLYLIVTFF